MSTNWPSRLAAIKVTKFAVAHRQIADQLHETIVAGAFKPGEALPTATALAAKLAVSTFTVHKALTALVKAGLLTRRRGVGTFVTGPADADRGKCVALFYGRDFWSLTVETAFYHRLHKFLTAELHRRKLAVRVFIDTRPDGEQHALPADLAAAVARREIDALIAPILTRPDFLLLKKLPLPVAFCTTEPFASRVTHDIRQFLAAATEQLAAAGARRVGLISGLAGRRDGTPEQRKFYANFFAQATAHGLATSEEWVGTCDQDLPWTEAERFGTEQFAALWRRAERPDALIVYPDILARGVARAMAEHRVAVPAELRLAVHQNSGLEMKFPFPATLLVSDVRQYTEALIKLIETQWQGLPPTPIYVPFTVREA